MKNKPCIKYISQELVKIIEKEMEKSNTNFVKATKSVAKRLANE